MSVIEVSSLTKTFRLAVKEPGLKGAVKHLFTQQYRTKTAVDRIDLHIKEGDSVAYVGPNGAGKSTTIKMLSGILVPTSGVVKVNGLVPYRERIRHAKQIGVVFGQRTQLWWDLPVRESFSPLKDIYEIPDAVYKKNLRDVRRHVDTRTRDRVYLGRRFRTNPQCGWMGFLGNRLSLLDGVYVRRRIFVSV